MSDSHSVVILSPCEAVRNHIASGLQAAVLPVTYEVPQSGFALLIVDAPDLFAAVVSEAVARASRAVGPKGPPVVFLNDNATPALREAAFQLGAADVMPRKVDLDVLVARVTRLFTMHATHSEALGLSHSAMVAPSTAESRPSARVFHLSPPATLAPLASTGWHVTTFNDAEALLAAAAERSWPEVIALPGSAAMRLLPGFVSRRGALNTQFICIETPVEAHAACLSHGAADAIPMGACPGEIAARIGTLAAEAQDIDRALAHLRAGLDMSYSDALTGLHNRRFFDQRFRGLFQRARLLGHPLSVLIFDIDGFKQINDSFGHAAGDTILKEFADRLSANVRAQDLVTRYGGEEFVVAMPQASINVAMGAAERVRAAIAEPGFAIQDGTLTPVTVSVGVATMSERDIQAEDFLARADAALFEAKGLGRNRVAQAA